MSEKLRPDGTPAPIGFFLQPIYPSRGGIRTCAVMSCIATGKMIDSMGGPGFALCPEVVRALDSNLHGHKARLIVDEEIVQNLVAAVELLLPRVHRHLISGEQMATATAALEAAKADLEKMTGISS